MQLGWLENGAAFSWDIDLNDLKLVSLNLFCDALHLKKYEYPCYCPLFLSIDLFAVGCLNAY